MDEFTKNGLKFDLVIGFGFSKANANITISLYEKDELSNKESEMISSLLKTPLQFSAGKHSMTLNRGIMETLEALNYRITIENG